MRLVARRAGVEVEVEVEPRHHGYRLTLGDRVYDVDVAVARGGDGEGVAVKSLIIAGEQHEVMVRRVEGRYRVSTAAGNEVIELLDPLAALAEQAHGADRSGKQVVTAYMPGVVKEVLVAEGDAVTAGQGLAILEAMKMENEIAAESAGTVTRVLVNGGQTVEGGDSLFEIE